MEQGQTKYILVEGYSSLSPEHKRRIEWIFDFWIRILGIKIELCCSGNFHLVLPRPRIPVNPENPDRETAANMLDMINEDLILESEDPRTSQDLITLFCCALSGGIIRIISNEFHAEEWERAVKVPFLEKKLKSLAEFWKIPYKKECRTVITHDLDDINLFSLRERIRKMFFCRPAEISNVLYQICQVVYTPFKAVLFKRKSHFFKNLVEFNRLNNIRSTYFIPFYHTAGDTKDTFYHSDDILPALLLSVRDFFAGCKNQDVEIGYHPGIWISNQNEHMFLEASKLFFKHYPKAKKICRQHYLHLKDHFIDFWKIADLAVDSSWGFNQFTGFAAGTSRPFYLWDKTAGSPSGILEFPFVIQDIALCGLGKNPNMEKIKNEIEYYIQVTLEYGGGLCVIFHPTYQTGCFPEFVEAYRYFIYAVKNNSIPVMQLSEAVGLNSNN
ncbi:MAG: hypothetical protein ABIA63_08435 [bacterium]